MPTQQFGIKLPNTDYIDRPGAYGIILNSEGKILIIDEDGAYYLPGGGIDSGETPVEALRREIMEEAGAEMDAASYLCEANQYVDAPAGHYNKLGKFYRVSLKKETVTQQIEGEVPMWVTLEDYFQFAVYEAQAWAVTKFFDSISRREVF